MTRAPHPDANQDEPVIVDLFAGPGGLDIAAEMLELPTIGVEWDESTRATRRAANLRTTKEPDVAKVNPLDSAVASARVLTGGPPCQTYSVAGNREGHKALEEVKDLAERVGQSQNVKALERAWAEVNRRAEELSWADERTGLVLQPLRWIVEKKLKAAPYEAVVLEQVPTVLPVWRKYRDILRELGYDADCHILHTEEYGVPQTRRRAVLIARYRGTRGQGIEFPSLTHQRYRKGVKRLPVLGRETPRHDVQQSTLFESPAKPHGPERWVSMRDALQETRSTDFVVRSNYGSGGDPKKRGLRTSDMPAATVTGKVRRNKVFELKGIDDDGEPELGPEQERFTFPEAGLLQTFPAEYPWRGTDVAQQIGNAIPPLLAIHVLCTALGLDEDHKMRATEALRSWRPPRP
ncbi:DNA methylase [Streptomyces spinoverrucosus]|uniref:DNA (cytosine-5-)-methyltransferase n=1 Tax=Streptomyces spinoverrucosus TaxID=284043 RepID=A0A4Y3VV79_9ACTN|nr:DNA cytosine methyltransferase [Streptomyces spinoverrucosus]GEC09661.1 DNA methylase [Streptomyces spinoverrucosus]GHB70702.1 DNA methylase [Streptomyces spinoverrucosus]